jgi:hypothetical protein
VALRKSKLRAELSRLARLPDAHAQQRGYGLERLFFDLLKQERLAPAAPFRPAGEQIDGLFEFESRYFLFECKWLASPPPPSDLYAFRSKVDGKLLGTIGLFISAAGFPSYAPTVLAHGKDLNILLFDLGDLEAALSERVSFRDVLRMKLRRAAQRGDVYYTYQRHLDERKV